VPEINSNDHLLCYGTQIFGQSRTPNSAFTSSHGSGRDKLLRGKIKWSISFLPHSNISQSNRATFAMISQDADSQTSEFGPIILVDLAIFGGPVITIARVGIVLAQNGPFAKFVASWIV